MRFAKGITLLVALVLAMLALVATSLFGGEAERTGAQYFAGTADPDELGPVPGKTRPPWL